MTDGRGDADLRLPASALLLKGTQFGCRLTLADHVDKRGIWTLPRLIGDARARALAFLAEPNDAELAAEWGMIWKAVEDELLDSETRKLCAHLASQRTRSFALMKKAFLQSAVQTFDQQLDLEAQLQGEAGLTEDYRTAVSAFRAKQSPVFEGR